MTESLPSPQGWTGFCALLTDGELSADDQHLVRALERRGWRVDGVDWRSEGPPWQDFDVVLIRSTWNYSDHLAHFLKVLRQIEDQHVQLENEVELVEWNCDKRYLRDLQDRGVPIVPTVWCALDAPQELAATLASALEQWPLLVAKPAVGANASGVLCLERSAPDNEQRLLDLAMTVAQRRPDSAVLLQPMVEAVRSEGEYSLFYFAGEFSHAVVKRPRSGEFRVQECHGGITEATCCSEALHEAGETALRALERQPLYARVDLMRAPDGEFWLVELELIEPSLYLAHDAQAADRLAVALEERAA